MLELLARGEEQWKVLKSYCNTTNMNKMLELLATVEEERTNEKYLKVTVS